MTTGLDVEWRGRFEDHEVNVLHGDAFGHQPFDDRWNDLVVEHSLGWVTARSDGALLGFTNVLWDGQVHAWIQDVIVARFHQRSGIGTALVRAATVGATTAGCEWLHVDFDDHLTPFYIDVCGFAPTRAGLLDLTAERSAHG